VAGAAKGVGKRLVTTVQELLERSGACAVDELNVETSPHLHDLVWM
jgi:hypothetical protein